MFGPSKKDYEALVQDMMERASRLELNYIAEFVYAADRQRMSTDTEERVLMHESAYSALGVLGAAYFIEGDIEDGDTKTIGSVLEEFADMGPAVEEVIALAKKNDLYDMEFSLPVPVGINSRGQE